jgi:ribose 1,5-bisphosphate isomerase
MCDSIAMDHLAAVRRLSGDSRSGASELLPQAVALLRAVLAQAPGSIDAVARAVGEAQPSMAPFWNAALSALRDGRDAGALDRFEARRLRAGRATARVAADALRPAEGRRLRVVTWSYSGSVLACVRALAERAAGVAVASAEGRPALEGRRFAEALAADGLEVDAYSDAGIAGAFAPSAGEERVVLIGADAVTPGWLINKVGSGLLAAAAADAGIPVYVAATRDKFADARVARLLRIVEHDSREIWDEPPAGVVVRNAYFERVPTRLVSGFVTDGGVLSAEMIEEACRAASADVQDEDVARLAPRKPPAAR